MAAENPEELPDIDREIRINELRHELDDLTGGEMTFHTSAELPPDLEEQFLRNVVEYERAPLGTHFDQLVEAGFELPAPDELDDAALTQKLWELIHKLAEMRVFLSQTDHLSDRELYAHLWSDSLRETVAMVAMDGYSAYHIDILGSYGEEEVYLHNKYYADEQTRQRWKQDFPDDEMPDHVDPPYDRDRRLPKATYAPHGDVDDSDGLPEWTP